MLEFLICSLLTIFPDYLFRRYVQGKANRPRDQSLFDVVRASLRHHRLRDPHRIADPMIFYFHPSTSNVTAIFRTIHHPAGVEWPGGRGLRRHQREGSGRCRPLFRLDTASKQAALETARRRVAEIEAETTVAKSELASADGLDRPGGGSLPQALNELETQVELNERNPNIVRDGKLSVAGRRRRPQGCACRGRFEQANTGDEDRPPPAGAKGERRSSARPGSVELEKTTVRAGVAGTFNNLPFVPAKSSIDDPLGGILVPEGRRIGLIAGFWPDRGPR